MQDSTCCVDGCEKPRKKGDTMCSMHRTRVQRHGSPDGKAQRPSLLARIRERIVVTDAGCWEWTGCVNNYGYAVLRYGATNAYAHRVIFEAEVGQIPAGRHVDHICHNTTCCNPKHLRLVSQKQNNENYSKPDPRNTSGYRGVSWHKSVGKWVASVGHEGRIHIVGYFDDVHEAGAAALRMRLQLHTHNELDRR